jgi:glutamyl-tRNA synthetase
MADVNAHYVRQASEAELLRRLKDYLPEQKDGKAIAGRLDEVGWDKFAAALPALKQRAKTLQDLIDGAGYLLATRPLPLDAKAAALLDPAAKSLLSELLAQLEAETNWQSSALEMKVRAVADSAGQKLGKIAQPLRAVLTGRTVSPPVFDVMAVLGREETLARIRDQLR